MAIEKSPLLGEKGSSHPEKSSTSISNMSDNDEPNKAVERMLRFFAFRLATDYDLKTSPYKLLPKDDWHYFLELSHYCRKFTNCFGDYIMTKDKSGKYTVSLPLSDARFVREIAEPCKELGLNPIRDGLYDMFNFKYSMIRTHTDKGGYFGIGNGYMWETATLANLRIRLIKDRDGRIPKVTESMPHSHEAKVFKGCLVAANHAIASRYFVDPTLGPNLELTDDGTKAKKRQATFLAKYVASPFGKMSHRREHTRMLGMSERLKMSDEEAQKLSKRQRRQRLEEKSREHKLYRCEDVKEEEKSDETPAKSEKPYDESDDESEWIDEKSPGLWTALN